MTTLEVATVIISVLALVVSIFSLWMANLSPFNLRVLNDSPTFAVYKITPEESGDEEGQTWWIPSFDIGISFYNLGMRPGLVKDVRILAEFRGLLLAKKGYAFYPKWIVDYSKFEQSRPDRFDWIVNAVIREWYPVLIGGKGEVHLHLILESFRWDHRESGDMSLRLETLTSKKKAWVLHQRYLLDFPDSIFDTNDRYTASSEGEAITRDF